MAAALERLVADSTARDGDGHGSAGESWTQPRRVLVDVAAWRGAPRLAAELSDAVLRDHLTDTEWAVLLTVAVHGLLATGSEDLADAVAIALPRSRSPWTTLGTVALRWSEDARRPLPVDGLCSSEARRLREADSADRWRDLDRVLEAFDRFSPPFTVGTGTQRFLLRADGPLSLLTEAARSEDQVALVTWLEDPRLEETLDRVAGLLPKSAAKELPRRIEAQRATVVNALTMRARVLRDRADRINGIAVDVGLIESRARARRRDGEELLVTLERQIERAEQVETDNIGRRLRKALGDEPSNAALAWADQVAALLAVREIRAATGLRRRARH